MDTLSFERLITGLIACVSICSVAFPQAPSWKLPDGGCVTYSRRGEWAAHEPSGEARINYRGGSDCDMLPVVFADELDESGRRLGWSPPALRAVAPWIAFDLQTCGAARRVRFEFPRVEPFGTLMIAGKVDRVTAGRQTFDLKITRAPAEVGRELPENFRASLDHYLRHDLEAELTLTRHWDEQRGIVTHFDYELKGSFTYWDGDGNAPGRLTARESWVAKSVRERRDARFRRQVDRAIEHGVARSRELLEEFADSTLVADERDSGLSGPAYEAMLIVGLCAGGVPPADPVLARSFERLKSRKMSLPKTLAYALLAMDAMRGGRLETGELDLAKRWTKRLLATRDKEAGPHLRWWWEPGHGNVFHNETTWRAVLGLRAAARCGVEVPAAAWVGAARHLLAVQHETGGWDDAHRDSPHYCYGASTAGALAALTACLDNVPPRFRQLRDEIDAAKQRGLGWLVAHANFRDGPAILPVHAQYFPEYLFALRMVCEWNRLERLGGRDWYHEGSTVLCAYLDTVGNFYPAGCNQTSIALTFLRPTGVGDPVTPSGR